jgi:hypothetical protein
VTLDAGQWQAAAPDHAATIFFFIRLIYSDKVPKTSSAAHQNSFFFFWNFPEIPTHSTKENSRRVYFAKRCWRRFTVW